MPAQRQLPVPIGIAAAALAVLIALHGLGARDLAGDELNMLHGTPRQIVEWSLDPRGGFVGHLPLSFWTRWFFLSLFTEVPAWAWRLHAVLFTALTVALTADTARRHLGSLAGAVAGLLLAFDPILGFHAQEASNYAASALTGVLIVRGLLDLSTHRLAGSYWLGFGLVMAATNDFYSALVALPALGICLLLARRSTLRLPITLAWIGPLVGLGPFIGLFILRLVDSTDSAVLAVHADPLPPRPLPAMLDAPWRVARRMIGAHLNGYAGGRNDAPWLGLPPVLFAGVLLVGRLRSPAWPAAGVVLGGLLVHGVLGVGFQLGTERVLPYEPRTLIGLTPALAIAIAACARVAGGPFQWSKAAFMAVPAIWFTSTSLATLEAHLSVADLRDQAIRHARQVAPGALLVIPDSRTRGRTSDAVACAPRDTPEVVVVMNHSVDQMPTCDGPIEATPTHQHFFDAPVHEGSAASFHPRRVVAVFGRSIPASPLRVERTLGDGLRAPVWALTDRDGATLAHGLERPVLPSERPWTVLSATPTAPAWLPDHPLLSAHRNQVQSTEVDPLDRRPVLRAAALKSPWSVTIRRILPILGLLFAFLTLRRPR